MQGVLSFHATFSLGVGQLRRQWPWSECPHTAGALRSGVTLWTWHCTRSPRKSHVGLKAGKVLSDLRGQEVLRCRPEEQEGDNLYFEGYHNAS